MQKSGRVIVLSFFCSFLFYRSLFFFSLGDRGVLFCFLGLVVGN